MSEEEADPEIGFCCAVLTYYSYAILIFFGHIREFVGSILGTSRYKEGKPKKGYSELLKSWESFYTRRLFHRIQDCWSRPICSSPGSHIQVMERVSEDNNKTLRTTGNFTDCINVGSYNYLGYADDWKETCSDDVRSALHLSHLSICLSIICLSVCPSVIHQLIDRSYCTSPAPLIKQPQ